MLRAVGVVVRVQRQEQEQVQEQVQVPVVALLVLLLVLGAVSQFRRALLRVERWWFQVVKSFSGQ